MSKIRVFLLTGVAVAALATWLWRRPSRDDVDALPPKFVRVVCESDVVERYEHLGYPSAQALVGPISPARDAIFAEVRDALDRALVRARERRSYVALVGCKVPEIRAFDQAVVAGVASRCPEKRRASLPDVVTLVGVVAQSY